MSRFIRFGVPEGIRTPDPRLRRAMLYPAELLAQKHANSIFMERVMGIGPTRPAWKAGTLPLSYTRIRSTNMLTNNSTSIFYCQ